jgi:hypothetical protein
MYLDKSTWLRCLPLNQGTMGSSPNRVMTMFLHMTPVLVGLRSCKKKLVGSESNDMRFKLLLYKNVLALICSKSKTVRSLFGTENYFGEIIMKNLG